MFSENDCGSFKISSLGPMRLLKTQVFRKRGKLSKNKRFWPILSRIFECDKHRGTNC